MNEVKKKRNEGKKFSILMENSEKGVQTIVDIYIYWKFVHNTGRGLAPFRFRKQEKKWVDAQLQRPGTSSPAKTRFIELDGAGGKTARSRAKRRPKKCVKSVEKSSCIRAFNFPSTFQRIFGVEIQPKCQPFDFFFLLFFLPSLLSSSPFRPNDGNFFFLLFSVLFSPNTQPIGIRCLNYWREKK